MCHREACRCPARCAICGRFLSYKEKWADVSVTYAYAYDYEPAEFKPAHVKCAKRAA